jgi:MoaA/NifB/PqqE/SkfB family radical SAM enzyme
LPGDDQFQAAPALRKKLALSRRHPEDHVNQQIIMPNVISMARQAVRGVPYLQKELGRRLSLSTSKALTTPMTYYVIFSGRCNLACTFCTIYTAVEPILSAETMLRIVREARDLSGTGFNISLSGGEPTIYKPLYDTLALAHQLGVNFGFTTNGLALTKSNCERLLSHDPFNINVSLESVDPQINESLRPMKDGTKRTLEGIDNLLAEKQRSGSRVSVIVKPTIMEQNYRGLPALVRHFGTDSKIQIHFQPYVGDANKPFWIKDIKEFHGVLNELQELRRQGYPIILNDRHLEGFLEYFTSPPTTGNIRHLDLGGHKRNCDIGLRSMFVFPNGDVHFCDYLGQPIGNIYKHSLSDIYYGATAGDQRKTMIYCNIDCQQTCKRPISLWVKARAFLRMG